MNETFEEKFPSLKEFMYEDMRYKSVFCHKDMQEIIINRCLDKTRVKEAIEKINDEDEMFADYDIETIGLTIKQRLLKELNLE